MPTPPTPSKLPHLTLAFWVMKICATTLGETAGDLLSMTLQIGYAASSILLLSLFVASLAAQLLSARYRPALYWTVILTTSTAGTTMSDYMDRTLGLGYATGSLILLVLLATTLGLWRIFAGTLSVDSVATRRIELVYWVAILISNTLGTALGDFLADDTGLGFAGGAALIAGAILLVVVAYRITPVSWVFLFWSAFVLTRPLGATLGDVLTKPVDSGGLGIGTIGSSLVLATVLVALVGRAMRQERSALR